MVANLFFRVIKGLGIDSSFSSADLVATIATYFDFNTSSVEIEATAAVNFILATLFESRVSQD